MEIKNNIFGPRIVTRAISNCRGVHDSNKSGKLLRKVGKKGKEPEVKPEEKKIMKKKRKKIDKGILARRKLERLVNCFVVISKH